MQETVTYSLKLKEPNSEPYYRRVREFTDVVIDRAAPLLLPAVAEFTDYIRTFRLEAVRRDEEYLLELLSFAILWNAYGGYALAVRRAPFVMMARMAEWRKRHQRLKPVIDLARGILTTVFLVPRRGRARPAMLPTLKEVDRLCIWLEATGEFREQALRVVLWRAFWETTPAPQRAQFAAALFSFAGWFVAAAEDALGEFTRNVEGFLGRTLDQYRWREDRVQCTRSRAEYHLNMVGAEIMNRAFREEFGDTEATAVLVPGCMRGRAADECRAVRVPQGLRCEGCLPQCRVNQLREMGRKHDFDVCIIPHASNLSLWSPRPGEPLRGVVASACVTTLVEGGWELKRYNVPAQCVLLDYTGCKKHWHPEGVPTAFNVRELKRILDTRAGRAANTQQPPCPSS